MVAHPLGPPYPPEQLTGLRARWELFTYALSRLPPRQLPFLALYAYTIKYLADQGWIPTAAVGKAGGSIVGVLSMVTGLLLSYRFSSAVSKWEEGKKVWVNVRTAIRDAMRLLSIAATAEDTAERTNELAGLFVGFAFALQHHLHGTRPLPQAPLCDLLPPGYLASLKRTDARVRFADAIISDATDRPGLRRRPTGPSKARSEVEWDILTFRDRAEDAVTRLAEAVTGGVDDAELRQQLGQLNRPTEEPSIPKPRSNLALPAPANLPLAILKLMEAYVTGLAEVPQGGWSEAKRDRALGVVKALCVELGQAERLAANPPPLPLTLHLSHVLLIYLAALPCSLLCVVTGWALVPISVIAGWCLLGLEALVGDVGGVFGGSENHQPLPLLARRILVESLDTCPAFLAYYRARLGVRVGMDDAEVARLDRRRGEDWMPF